MTLRRGTRALLCLTLLIGGAMLYLMGKPHRTAPRPPRPPAPSADVLHLQWVRELPALRPAWPDQPRMQFDAAYRPVVHGDRLLLSSSRNDSVNAYDSETGAESWHFTTDGPVRFTPVIWEDRVYVVSDDGFLYCLDLADGNLIWKFRGGPADRRNLGNGRLISTWPARGAPAVADGTVYFAAGIWPFMGVFIHALDARTGAVVWTNDGDGSTFMQQPHNAEAFGGVAPQGALVVAGDKLLVPGGRSVPACYNRRTGKLVHYKLAENSKIGGGSEVSAAGGLFVNGGALFDVASGDHLGPVGEQTVLTEDVLYSCSGTQCQVFDLRSIRREMNDSVNRRGERLSVSTWSIPKLATATVPQVEALALAPDRLYAAGAGQVFSLKLPLKTGPVAPTWRARIQGTPVHVLTEEGRVFVSTREGRLYCFAPPSSTGHRYPPLIDPPDLPDEDTEKARDILATADVREGYCLLWGGSNTRLVVELVRQSNLHVITVEPDAEKVRALREELISNGLHGDRAAVVSGDWRTVQLPPYFASLMLAEEVPADPAFLRKTFACLRPYGGVACLPAPAAAQADEFEKRVADLDLPQAWVRKTDTWLLLSREGALPGAANWTHENADAANTRVSHDRLAMAPLGILWFGGPPHNGILPRHGHGPAPQVIDGRLIIEGVDMLRAMDIYTGRLLWETRLPGVGRDFDNTSHQPGANASSGNYVSTSDGIYVAYGKSCLRLDPTTGKRLAEYRQAPLRGTKEVPEWSFVTVCDNYLIGGANPPRDARDRHATVASSKRLTVLDRHSGQVLWEATAEIAFRHFTICAGGGKVYCIDRPSADYLAALRRHGDKDTFKPRVLAFDLATGREAWRCDDDVFGTWLGYSEKLGVLVESGRVARDTLYDEPPGVRAYCAENGTILWHRGDYAGPAMIRGAEVLTHHGACDLRTGAPLWRFDPLTGQQCEWSWARGYGCNTPAASEHLLTFRSGAAGYFDLAHDGGTGNFGGFRSGCTNNLIVAGGLLNAPDYTRTCTCSYQNQASLALVPMPEAEMWTYYGSQAVKGTVRRVGINLGAPGNRKADDGTLWLEYPPVGGPSLRLPITTVPEKPEWFRHHSSQISGEGVSWAAASGARGLKSLTVNLGTPTAQERTYTVRLHFAEPDMIEAGQRIFNVALQGQTVLSDFDVCREAGGPRKSLVKEFKGIKVTKDLVVTLTPGEAAPGCAPILCGVEIVAEGW